MLDIIFIIIFFFTILLMFYGIMERSPAFTILSAVLWLILAALLIQGIEIPYEIYNSTSGNIETGVHTIQTNLDPLAYLFMFLAVINFILFATFTLEAFTEYKKLKL